MPDPAPSFDAMDDGYQGFVLTRSHRDTPAGLRIELWLAGAQGPAHVVIEGERPLFFVDRCRATGAGERKPVALKSLAGDPVDAVYFRRQRDLIAERERLLDEHVLTHEGDIKPADRFLMERFITAGVRVLGEGRDDGRAGVRRFRNPRLCAAEVTPQLTSLSIDIETDGFDGPILSIAAVGCGRSWCGIVGDGPPAEAVSYHGSERALLDAFVALVEELDPDLLLGWNLIEFDLRHLVARSRALKCPLRLGRDGEVANVLAPRRRNQPHVARIPGRVALDGIATLRNATYSFESFALEDVAQQLLGRGKSIDEQADKVAEIRRLYAEDKPALAAYNLQDCRLVADIFEATDLITLAVVRQQLTGLPLDRNGGAVAAFDQLYLPRLHRSGCVAPSVGLRSDAAPSPGGYVLDSQPGLYRDVLVLDFKSLYPSIIRTFCIDPLGLAFPGEDPVPGFASACFAREGHILPGVIEQLWSARDDAKRAGHAAMSQAVKILMNSFYGVLGTPACRFFDPRLATSITRRGHEIITRSRDFLTEQGLSVIYGDTDSLFVHLPDSPSESACRERGAALASAVNRHWRERLRAELRLESQLEVQFETHYLRFVMPTMRGSERGTKKRYAGLRRKPDGGVQVVFKGLEAVRTDWTPAARAFQRELFRRVMCDEPYEDLVRATAEALRAGGLDDQLVYRKRLRRDLSEYRHNVPPHVQAARKLERVGRHVEYVMTVRGPEPTAARTAALDYQHYLERQLAPAANTLLHFLGTSFEAITDRQLHLFGRVDLDPQRGV